ncbi:MAG: hypothetical protein LUD72_09400 [Bacteroidales bacterium]|nr:hypothetical protein [Bacteroidales bacterium]
MSVLKSKRQPSDFEVFHQYYQLRREITDLLLRDFGYSREKEEKKLRRQFNGKDPEELGEEAVKQYEKAEARDDAFDEWFVKEEREAILTYLRNLGQYLFSANDIYPQYKSELEQRRIYQDKALGCCEVLMQELQYIIETLPVNINKYTRFADMIQHEISLIKAWRKSDNKFKKIVDK